MKKRSLKTWIADFKLVLVRFPFTLLFIVGLSVLCFLSIQKVKVEIRESLWAFFMVGILLNVTVTLYLEEFKKMGYRILLNILSILLLGVYCMTLPEKLFEYQSYQLVALGAVFALSAFIISFLKRNNDNAFWNFSRDSIIEMFISFVFSGVLFAGLSLAFLSLDKLFAIRIHQEVYSNLAVVCFVIFAPIYFLSNIPNEVEKRRQEISFNKIIKIFGMYILLPILAVYTLILYVYLLRIIVKWELPNGWVSTLVSILGLVGFLCMIILYPLRVSKENKIPELLSRYFPIVLFPLLGLMLVGILRRMGDYGLTINRCYVLVLNVWLFVISIYLFLTQSRHVKWIIISFVTVAFLCSVGPWSVYSITQRSLSGQLDKQLNQAHLLKNGKIISVNDKTLKIDSTTQIKLVETLRYLVRTYGNQTVQKYFAVSLKDKTESMIIAMLNLKEVPNSFEYFWGKLESQSLREDIKPFQSFLYLKSNSQNTVVYEDATVNIELINDCLIIHGKLKNHPSYRILLKDKIKSLIWENKKNKKNEFSKDMMTLKGDNYVLILKNLNGSYDFQHDKLDNLNLEAYLFN